MSGTMSHRVPFGHNPLGPSRQAKYRAALRYPWAWSILLIQLLRAHVGMRLPGFGDKVGLMIRVDSLDFEALGALA